MSTANVHWQCKKQCTLGGKYVSEGWGDQTSMQEARFCPVNLQSQTLFFPLALFSCRTLIHCLFIITTGYSSPALNPYAVTMYIYCRKLVQEQNEKHWIYVENTNPGIFWIIHYQHSCLLGLVVYLSELLHRYGRSNIAPMNMIFFFSSVTSRNTKCLLIPWITDYTSKQITGAEHFISKDPKLHWSKWA